MLSRCGGFQPALLWHGIESSIEFYEYGMNACKINLIFLRDTSPVTVQYRREIGLVQDCHNETSNKQKEPLSRSWNTCRRPSTAIVLDTSMLKRPRK